MEVAARVPAGCRDVLAAMADRAGRPAPRARRARRRPGPAYPRRPGGRERPCGAVRRGAGRRRRRGDGVREPALRPARRRASGPSRPVPPATSGATTCARRAASRPPCSAPAVDADRPRRLVGRGRPRPRPRHRDRGDQRDGRRTGARAARRSRATSGSGSPWSHEGDQWLTSDIALRRGRGMTGPDHGRARRLLARCSRASWRLRRGTCGASPTRRRRLRRPVVIGDIAPAARWRRPPRTPPRSSPSRGRTTTRTSTGRRRLMTDSFAATLPADGGAGPGQGRLVADPDDDPGGRVRGRARHSGRGAGAALPRPAGRRRQRRPVVQRPPCAR